MNEQEKQREVEALIAEYAFGLLTEEEALAVEDMIAVDPELERSVAAWMIGSGTLGDRVAPMVPPAHLKAKLVGKKRKGLNIKLPDLSSVLYPIAAVALLAVLAGSWVLTTDAPAASSGGRLTNETFMAKVAMTDEAPFLFGVLHPQSNMLNLRPRREGELSVAPLNHVHTLWVRDKDSGVIRLGNIEPDGTAAFEWPEGVSPNGAELTLSLERRGAVPARPSKAIEGQAVLEVQ